MDKSVDKVPWYKKIWMWLVDKVKNIDSKIAILFLATFITFWLWDFIMKIVIFEPDPSLRSQVSWGIIGWRSLPHDNTTIFESINIHLSSGGLSAFSCTIAVVLIIFGIFTKQKWIAFFLGIAVAGVFGNTVDRWWRGYVMDIIYIPWLDKGTFNFADVFIIAGTAGFGITLLVLIVKGDKKMRDSEQDG